MPRTPAYRCVIAEIDRDTFSVFFAEGAYKFLDHLHKNDANRIHTVTMTFSTDGLAFQWSILPLED